MGVEGVEGPKTEAGWFYGTAYSVVGFCSTLVAMIAGTAAIGDAHGRRLDDPDRSFARRLAWGTAGVFVVAAVGGILHGPT
jgi:hypothetical protein